MSSLKTIAELLGLSTSTVSRALSGSPLVSDATRQRVRAMAEQLGYEPDPAAQALRTRKSDIVAFLIPPIGYPYGTYHSKLLLGVQHSLAENEMHLLMVVADERGEALKEKMRHLMRDSRIGGIINAVQCLSSEDVEMYRSLEFPIVIANAYADPRVTDNWDGITIVGIDNLESGRTLAKALIGMGHREFAFIGGSFSMFDTCRLRYEGLTEELGRSGIEIRPEHLLQTPKFDRVGGRWAAEELLGTGSLPSAVVAGNDQMGAGAMEGFRACGLDIPRDVSVSGFDNDPWSDLMTPPLTTMDQDSDIVGEEAARLLCEMIHDRDGYRHRQVLIPSRLRLRGSCGKPKN